MTERRVLDSEAHERINYLSAHRDAAMLVERALSGVARDTVLSAGGKALAVKANATAHEQVSGVVTSGVVYDLSVALLYAVNSFTRKDG